MPIVNQEGIPILTSPEQGHPPRLIDIALVSHDQCPVLFAYDLAQLMAFTAANLPDGVHLGLNLQPGTYVHSGRQTLLSELKDRGSHWVLWLDTDMRIPRDTLVRLISHNLPLVGINYAKRHVDSDYVAIKTVGWEPGEESQRLATLPDSTGLEEVDAIGFGAFLMRGDVIQSLPPLSERPWFEMTWLKDKQQWVGEDVAFCKLLRDLGHRIFVDHDLSRECFHVGQFEYHVDQVTAIKQEMNG